MSEVARQAEAPGNHHVAAGMLWLRRAAAAGIQSIGELRVDRSQVTPRVKRAIPGSRTSLNFKL